MAGKRKRESGASGAGVQEHDEVGEKTTGKGPVVTYELADGSKVWSKALGEWFGRLLIGSLGR
jgi:hypothetical protein